MSVEEIEFNLLNPANSWSEEDLTKIKDLCEHRLYAYKRFNELLKTRKNTQEQERPKKKPRIIAYKGNVNRDDYTLLVPLCHAFGLKDENDTETVITPTHSTDATEKIKLMKANLIDRYPKSCTNKLREVGLDHSAKNNATILSNILKYHKRNLLQFKPNIPEVAVRHVALHYRVLKN